MEAPPLNLHYVDNAAAVPVVKLVYTHTPKQPH